MQIHEPLVVIFNLSNLVAQVTHFGLRHSFFQYVNLHVLDQINNVSDTDWVFARQGLKANLFSLLFNFSDTIVNVTYFSLLVCEGGLPGWKIFDQVLDVVL